MQLAAPPPTAFSTLPHSDVVDVTRKAASPRRRVWHPRRSAACRAGFHPAWGCTTTSSHRIPTPPHHRAWFRADAGATKTLLVQLKHLTRRFDRSRVEHSCAAMPTWRAVLHRNVWSDGAGSSPHLHGRLGLHRKDRSWGHMSQACGQQPSAVCGGGHFTLLSRVASQMLPTLLRGGTLLCSLGSPLCCCRGCSVGVSYFTLACRIVAVATSACKHSTLLLCVASQLLPTLPRAGTLPCSRVLRRHHRRCGVGFRLVATAVAAWRYSTCSPVPHRRCC